MKATPFQFQLWWSLCIMHLPLKFGNFVHCTSVNCCISRIAQCTQQWCKPCWPVVSRNWSESWDLSEQWWAAAQPSVHLGCLWTTDQLQLTQQHHRTTAPQHCLSSPCSTYHTNIQTEHHRLQYATIKNMMERIFKWFWFCKVGFYQSCSLSLDLIFSVIIKLGIFSPQLHLVSDF